MSGSRYCQGHNPKLAKARRIGAHRAALALHGQKPPDIPAAEIGPLDSREDLRAFLAATIRDVRRGRLDRGVGDTIARLSNTLLSTFPKDEAAPPAEQTNIIPMQAMNGSAPQNGHGPKVALRDPTRLAQPSPLRAPSGPLPPSLE